MEHSIDELVKKYVVAKNIDLGEYETEKLGLVFGNGWIFVNAKAAVEEQVRTVLHEVFHLHPDFMAYTRGLWEGKRVRDELIEAQIEGRASNVYMSRSDLVAYIVQELGRAKALPLNADPQGAVDKARRNT